jgi:hypothetical protein
VDASLYIYYIKGDKRSHIYIYIYIYIYYSEGRAYILWFGERWPPYLDYSKR